MVKEAAPGAATPGHIFYLISNDARTRDWIRLAVDWHFHAEVKEFPNADQALAQIRNDVSREGTVILAGLQDPGFADLASFQDSTAGKTAFGIYWGETPPKDLPRRSAVIRSSRLAEDLVKTIEETFPKWVAAIREQMHLYCPVAIQILRAMSPCFADVYILLSEAKGVKIFQTGDDFDDEDLRRFKDVKKMRFLALKRAEVPSFSERFAAAIEAAVADQQEVAHPPVSGSAPVEPAKEPAKKPERVKSEPKLQEVKATEPPKEKAPPPTAAVKKAVGAALAQTPALAIETMQQISSQLGFTPEVQQLVHAGMNHAVAAAKKNPHLRDLFKSLELNPDQYIASHSHFTGQLACILATQMDWKSEATFQKLSFVAMMHDITLTNHSLAAIQTLKELESRKAEFTDEEIEAYKLHPTKVNELIRPFEDVPSDVDPILAEHHERPDGSGFPRGIAGSRIGPLSAVFIVAHDLVDEVFKQGKGTKLDADLIQRFVGDRQKVYEGGTFKKFLKVLEKIKL